MPMKNINKWLNEKLHIILSSIQVLSAFFRMMMLDAWTHPHLTSGKWEQQKMQVKSRFHVKHFLLRLLNKPWKAYFRID